MLEPIDIAVVLGVALGPASSLLRSLRDPLAYEKKYRQAIRFLPLKSDMRGTGLQFLVGAAAFAWAAYRANLGLLWAVLSPVVGLLGLAALLASFARPAKSLLETESPPAIDTALRVRRRITQVLQALFLSLWFYSWRGLAA